MYADFSFIPSQLPHSPIEAYCVLCQLICSDIYAQSCLRQKGKAAQSSLKHFHYSSSQSQKQLV